VRNRISILLIALTPVAISAADAPPGVIYGAGSVYLNGSQINNSMPVMAGDVVQTQNGALARLNMSGSSVTVQPNAIVRFQAAGLALDRGSVSVATGQKLAIFARDFQITPTSSDWTQFEVARSAGLIHIAAHKNSVSISCGMGAPTVVQEGHEITRADAQNCGMPHDSQSGARVAAKGPILNSLWAEGLGAGGAAAAITVFTQKHHDEPVSPDKP
jgi:hypothetical protein